MQNNRNEQDIELNNYQSTDRNNANGIMLIIDKKDIKIRQ